MGAYFLPIAFAICIALPFVNSTFSIWEFERKDENRAFTDSLSFNIAEIDSFPPQAEAYINDNFSFRGGLLDVYHHLKFSVYRVSPHPDKTVIGKNGWYFKAGDEQDIYEGHRNFTPKQLETLDSVWTQNLHFLNSMGIKAYWIIAPFKHYVYEEDLPMNLIPAKQRRVDQLKDYFEDKFPGLIIDPVPALRTAKSAQEMYYRMGNHWNYHAGRIVSELMAEELRSQYPSKHIPDLPTYLWKDTLVDYGIHSRALGIDGLFENRATPYLNPYPSVESKMYGFPSNLDWFPYPWEYERCFTNNSIENGLRLFIVRDSFGEQLMPYTREQYAECTYLFDGWQYNLHPEFIEQVKPDVVVFIGLETHIENFMY